MGLISRDSDLAQRKVYLRILDAVGNISASTAAQFLLTVLQTYSLLPDLTGQASRHKSHRCGLEYPY